MSAPPELIRAFIALALPPDLSTRIGELQGDCKRALPWNLVRWTRPENIHLTLHFLGNTSAAEVEATRLALPLLCQAAAPFRLRAEGLGCFPNPSRPRIIWVGVAGELSALARLQQGIAKKAGAVAGDQVEKFHPHLTLGRVKNAGRREARLMAEVISRFESIALGEWRVGQVELMRSRLAPSGPEYSCLAACPLGPG